MDFKDTKEEAKFRSKCREWLEKNASYKDESTPQNNDFANKDKIVAAKAWQKKKYDAGWAMLHWPAEYGGIGASSMERIIWANEESKFDVPKGIFEIGLGMCGPVMMEYATEDQKERYLPPMAEGKEIWCQLFSEPSAGSDVAGLRSKAVQDGDKWIINGQKVWTSGAHFSDFGILVVRHDPNEAKHKGMTFFFVDMKSPGIEVKPIITIDGDHEVNSVFFTDVKVPAENLIGEEGKGWTYAKFLLAHERFGIAGVGASKRQLERLKEISKDLGDDDLIAKVSQLEIDIMALEFTELRLLSALEGGGNPGAESSILKIKGTEIQQRLTELFVEAAGEFAIPYGGPDGYGSNIKPNGPEYTNDALSKYLNMRKVTIYGGSNEIQKNIISKFVLGI